MSLTFDPIWSWLASVSLASFFKPLEQISPSRLGLGGMVWLVALLLVMPGTGARRWRRIMLGLAVPAGVLLLAFLPLGIALALAVAALTVWAYVGVEKASPGRVLIILLLRLGALAIALMLVLRPSLAFDEDLKVPSTLVIVIDSSGSMNIQDELGGKSRWDKALSIVRSDRCARLLKQLASEKNVKVVFYRAAEDIAAFDPVDRPGPADGKRTDMARWLDTLLKRHGRDPNLRAVVLFSDGADNGNTSRVPVGDLAEQFQRIPCPFHPFAVGKKDTTLQQQDLAFIPDSLVTDPSPVGIKNTLTVKARLQVNGYQNPNVTLRLFFDNDKDPVAVKGMRLDRPLDEKSNIYEVEIAADAPPTPREMKVTLKVDPLPNEVSVRNNEISTFVTVTKEGLSVLYVEGTLRWEARFIRDAISGHRNLRLYKAFQTSEEEAEPGADWFQFAKRHYDVIIIGDVTAQRFTNGNKDVLKKIKELVSKEGTGLLMLAGEETFGKASDWTSFGKGVADDVTPNFTDILPIKFPETKEEANEQKVLVVPTKKGLDHYVMRLGDTPKKNTEIWEDHFLPLHGIYPLVAQDGASVLAVKENTKTPVIIGGKYGKGRTLVIAGDTTWNYWRRDEVAVDAHRRFWQQVVVWLARQENQDDTVWVIPDTRRVPLGGNLGFRLGMRGKEDRNITDARFKVSVVGPAPLKTRAAIQEQELIRGDNGEQRGQFTRTDVAGEYRLEVTALDKAGKPLPSKTASARFLVYEDDVEYRNPAADPETLEKIAQRSDGEFHLATEEQFARFLEELRHKPLPQGNPRPLLVPDWKQMPASRGLEDQLGAMWTSGILICFVLFCTLICVEWYLRRRWGLV